MWSPACFSVVYGNKERCFRAYERENSPYARLFMVPFGIAEARLECF